MTMKAQLLIDTHPYRNVFQILGRQVADVYLPIAIRTADIFCPLLALEYEYRFRLFRIPHVAFTFILLTC